MDRQMLVSGQLIYFPVLFIELSDDLCIHIYTYVQFAVLSLLAV